MKVALLLWLLALAAVGVAAALLISMDHLVYVTNTF